MTELTDSLRSEVSAEFQRGDYGPLAATKADIRDAVNGLDAWLDSSVSQINQAIPQPARSLLTVPQKIELLRFVLARRIIEGSDG